MAYAIHTLREKIRWGKFIVTVELEPPKSAEPIPTLEAASSIRNYVDAINIADNPMATLRMSPIALAHILQQDLGIEAVFHMSCRDRNSIGIQSELLGAAALGVRNILVITGDPSDKGDHPHAKDVFEMDSIGLIKTASALNQGRDLSGKKLLAAPTFFIGAGANPGADNLAQELEKLKRKVDAGVNFIQTQPVFDLETAERFLEVTHSFNLPILFGLLPLKSYKFACYFNEKVPGIKIKPEVLKRIEAGGRQEGIAIARELYEELQRFAHGVHIFPIGEVELVKEIVRVPAIGQQSFFSQKVIGN
ncbi:methylenetetrahydrofolate reductase [Zhaonella formicivorans]|uniref:methylenetetrahydrofolate reductase n=1 Tax=Zhaonella formicivorans TaxID=2528593 RepID=UPI0010D7030E|nr:methylenetetrahydrofolate reductase [Zhaonella formicivorans]